MAKLYLPSEIEGNQVLSIKEYTDMRNLTRQAVYFHIERYLARSMEDMSSIRNLEVYIEERGETIYVHNLQVNQREGWGITFNPISGDLRREIKKRGKRGKDKIAKRKKFAPHTLNSKRKIIATVLYHKGNITESAKELGYPHREYLSLLVTQWYKRHPGLESVIDTTRRKSKEASKRKRDKEIVATVLYHKGHLPTAAKELDMDLANLSHEMKELYKKHPSLEKIIHVVDEASKEEHLDKLRRFSNKDLLATYFKNNLNGRRTSKELGYSNESVVRERILYLRRKVPILDKVLKANMRKIKNPHFSSKSHTIYSKKYIIATVLYHKGHLPTAAKELGYKNRNSLSCTLKRFYKEHQGLKEIIETVKKR